ncbi:hypothetical protein K402DRAFT_304258, partial [Aulographum hederae CBS 113979]
LDHLILLLPHSTILRPPPWLTRHFTLTPGGRHADGKTENVLIGFKDGSYIELIAFVGDEVGKRSPARDGHWWGGMAFGIVDWALTTTTTTAATSTAESGSSSDAEANFNALNERLASLDSGRYNYAAPVKGGRTKPDGSEIKWSVTFPSTAVERGALPFYCHDETARELRVPVAEEATTHPYGAWGIEGLTVEVCGLAESEK